MNRKRMLAELYSNIRILPYVCIYNLRIAVCFYKLIDSQKFFCIFYHLAINISYIITIISKRKY